MFTVGCASAPLIISILISDHTSEDFMNVTLPYNSSNESTMSTLNKSLDIFNSSVDVDTGTASRVKYAYLLIGVFPLLNAVAYVVLFAAHGPTCCKTNQSPLKERAGERALETSTLHYRISDPYSIVVFLIILFIYYISFVTIETIPGTFLSVFAVNELNSSEQYGAKLLSTFWLSQTVIQLIIVPLSYWISSLTIMITCLILVTCGNTLLAFSPYLGDTGLIMSIVVSGLGSGPLSAAQITWVSSHIEFTGFVSGLCCAACSVGRMLCMPLTDMPWTNLVTCGWFIFL